MESIRHLLPGLACGGALLLAACGSSSSSEPTEPPFRPRSTDHGTTAGAPVVMYGDTFVYFASEAASGAQDLNGDLDLQDDVASYVDIPSRTETLIGIAAETAVILDGVVFLAVNEDDDGRDWDGDGLQEPNERSLVYWTPSQGQGIFVTRLDPDSELPLLKSWAGFAYALEEETVPGSGRTNIVRLRSSTPQVPVNVLTEDDAADGLLCELEGTEEGLVKVTLDESENGDLNDDGDETDRVLAVLNGAQIDTLLVNTAFAVDEDPVVRARALGGFDWMVAFLTDEATQPEPEQGLGFNNRGLFTAAWIPESCPGSTDDDTEDDVVQIFQLLEFQADPVTSPVVNTGLVGTDRIVLVDGYVGVVSDEADDGPCDMNGDLDTEDRIFRWAPISLDPELQQPITSPSLLKALVEDVPGGTRGVAELDGAFVIIVDEEADGERNYDESLADEFETLIAWYDPDGGELPGWSFDQRDGSVTDEPIYGSPSWMGETEGRVRLTWAGREEVFDENFNVPSGQDGPDMDKDDSIPMLSALDRNLDRLTLSFVRIAADPTNAGMVLKDGVLFTRFDEATDSRDLTNDGDQTDRALGGTVLSSGATAYVGGVAAIPGRPVVEVDGLFSNVGGAAFLASEVDDRTDHNGDGDSVDIVVRYFRF